MQSRLAQAHRQLARQALLPPASVAATRTGRHERRAVEQRNGPVGDGNRALRSGMHTSIRSMVDACMLVWCVSCGAFSRSQRLMSHVIVNRRQTVNCSPTPVICMLCAESVVCSNADACCTVLRGTKILFVTMMHRLIIPRSRVYLLVLSQWRPLCATCVLRLSRC